MRRIICWLQYYSCDTAWRVRDIGIPDSNLGNVELLCPKLFQAFSVKFTLIFFMSAFIQSFHNAKIMHIDAKLWLWDHFEKSVKVAKSTYYRRLSISRGNRPIIADRYRLQFIIFLRSKCSQSHNFAPICIIFACADVEWLNERTHETKLR